MSEHESQHQEPPCIIGHPNHTSNTKNPDYQSYVNLLARISTSESRVPKKVIPMTNTLEDPTTGKSISFSEIEKQLYAAEDILNKTRGNVPPRFTVYIGGKDTPPDIIA